MLCLSHVLLNWNLDFYLKENNEEFDVFLGGLKCWQIHTSWYQSSKYTLESCNYIFFFSHTLFSLFTSHPHFHQPIFFPSSASRVRKVSCRFSTGTWRSTVQCTMRPRDLPRSRPSWKTMVYCLSMSCSNCCARPRRETAKYLLPTGTHYLQFKNNITIFPFSFSSASVSPTKVRPLLKP